MSVAGGTRQRLVAPPLPVSIWVVAGAMLTGQLVLLAGYGIRDEDWFLLAFSAVIGGMVVGLVTDGVIRARMGRLVFSWVVLGLTLVGEVVALAQAGDLREGTLMALSLTTTVAALAGLARFHRTEWFAWKRANPTAREHTAMEWLVAVGFLVGVLGGVIDLPGV